MVKSSMIVSALAWAATVGESSAFSTAPQCIIPTSAVSKSELHAAATTNRRDLFVRAGSAVAGGMLTLTGIPNVASAAGEPPTEEELQRIRKGYENIKYLQNNWEKETTVCRENGGECKRNADAVRRYLGLRFTTDPLFQIEKVFAKVKYMDDIEFDKLEQFFDATEDWNTAMNMSNSMAFISQFAEYNPGGGKDEVLKYLNEAESQVVFAEKALKTIIECIDSRGSP